MRTSHIPYYILDKDRQVVQVPEMVMAQWRQDNPEGYRVAHTKVGSVDIATSFLCVSMGFAHLGDTEPLVFETWLRGEPEMFDDVHERCSTYDQALAQHERWVQNVTDCLSQEQDKIDAEARKAKELEKRNKSTARRLRIRR